MQRFGRTTQTKMKDGWGGSFVLAAILALALAYWGGTWLSQRLGGTDTAGSSTPGLTAGNSKTGTPNTAAAEPHQFQLYLVQVGAFSSPGKARDMMHTLTDHGYAAAMTDRGQDHLSRVYAGIFTSRDNADRAKSQLSTDGLAEQIFIPAMTVDHNPDAIPVSNMGAKSADTVKQGLDTLNLYLYEAAALMENRSTGGTVDTTNLTDLGKKLSEIATGMANEKDTKVQELAKVTSAAAVNARDMEKAASAALSSDEYQMAMSNYLNLLDQYRTLQSSK